MTKPTITILEDLDSGEFLLMATSYGQTMPAGPRLFRAPPHPDIKFTHADHAVATNHMMKLQQYINDCWPKKAMSKAKMRRGGD